MKALVAFRPFFEVTELEGRIKTFGIIDEAEGERFAATSLKPGEGRALEPIKEVDTKPYTEDEERSLSEIIQAFNERHGTQFTWEDFLRFE